MAHPTPRAKTLFTPFNVITGIILLAGAVLTVLRFTKGIGAVTNLDDNNPWGIWIGFDLLCGVALAAGGYVTCAACYIFGLKKFRCAVRPAILTAFLGYALVVLALHYDVGRPWRLPYPIFFSQGTSSLLFEVALCVFLYLSVLFLEFTPAAFEWLNWRRARYIIGKISLVLVIFGIILSTLHQSSLGALFLIAPSKLHPCGIRAISRSIFLFPASLRAWPWLFLSMPLWTDFFMMKLMRNITLKAILLPWVCQIRCVSDDGVPDDSGHRNCD
ncbi:MAG: hypothetical protein R2875_15410 [Desulfobacterales bacterium]